MTDNAGVDDQTTLHATAVAISGSGILIRGKSGSGKSDLALRLIDRGAKLIGDDQITIKRKEDQLLMSPPPTIAGKLEVRSLGICECEYLSGIALRLIIELKDHPDRFPMDNQVMILLGIKVPCCTLAAMETSAAIKAEWALQRVAGS